MSDITDWLDAIEAKWKPPLYAEPYGTPSDVAFLLDLARKQQAALDAVRDLASEDEWGRVYLDTIRAALEDRT